MCASMSVESARRDIEAVIHDRLQECKAVKPFALSVVFRERADVAQFMHSSLKHGGAVSDVLGRVSDDFPLIVFQNAHLSLPTDIKPSGDSDWDGCLQQDPFHVDFKPGVTGDVGPLSLLFKKRSGDFRDAPTYFAEPDAVKAAIAGLQKLRLPGHALSLIKHMLAHDSDFYLDSDRREELAELVPDFTDAVYNAIPDHQKYRHDWRENEDTVTMHVNDLRRLLHARGGTLHDRYNRIGLFDFYKT